MLRFDIGDIPVRVHFSFLLIAFFAARLPPAQIVVWTVTVFVAILAHELGHALTARAYGARPVTITLFALGGATTFPANAELSLGKRFVITAAGSSVGIVLGGAVLALQRSGVFDDASILVRRAVSWFILAALVWGLLNWIPIRPLDGGQMLTSALQMASPDRGAAIARVVSGVVGALIVVGAFVLDAAGPFSSTSMLAWANDVSWRFVALFVAFITVIGLRAEPADPGANDGSTESTPPGPVEREPREAGDRDGVDPPAFPI